jgi:hypothetical protein
MMMRASSSWPWWRDKNFFLVMMKMMRASSSSSSLSSHRTNVSLKPEARTILCNLWRFFLLGILELGLMQFGSQKFSGVQLEVQSKRVFVIASFFLFTLDHYMVSCGIKWKKVQKKLVFFLFESSLHMDYDSGLRWATSPLLLTISGVICNVWSTSWWLGTQTQESVINCKLFFNLI